MTSLSCCGLHVLLYLTEYFVRWNTPLAKMRSHASLEQLSEASVCCGTQRPGAITTVHVVSPWQQISLQF